MQKRDNQKLNLALNLLGQACALFQGNLKDHQALQDSLQLIKETLFPTPKPKSPEETKKKEVKNGRKTNGKTT